MLLPPKKKEGKERKKASRSHHELTDILNYMNIKIWIKIFLSEVIVNLLWSGLREHYFVLVIWWFSKLVYLNKIKLTVIFPGFIFISLYAQKITITLDEVSDFNVFWYCVMNLLLTFHTVVSQIWLTYLFSLFFHFPSLSHIQSSFHFYVL